MGIVQNQGGRIAGKKVWLNINKRNFHKVQPGQTAIVAFGTDQLLVKIVSVSGSRDGTVRFKAPDGNNYTTRGWNVWMIRVG